MRAHPLEAVRARINDFRAVFAIPAFATYQAGNFVMTIGFWMQRIAVGWVTWEMTGSEAWLGLVAFAELFPSLLTAVWGGSMADRHPVPRIMYWGQIASAAVSLLLAVLYFTDTLTPVIMALAMALLGAVSGVLLPARLAMASYLAPRKLLPSALAVNSTGFNLSRFIGPALAGLLLVVGSAGLVFSLSALGFVVLSISLHRIRNVPPQTRRTPDSTPVRLGQVLRDLTATPMILGVIALQLAQGMLIRPASEIFPAYAELAFDRGEFGLGMLNAALGVGAIVGALVLSRSRETREALVQILVMGAVFALTLIVFALTGSFWLALLVLTVHGAAMSSSNIAALAYVQLETPQDRLGRILSLYTIVFRVGPAVGAFVFGLTAEAAGLVSTGVVFGVAGLVATGLLALYLLGAQGRPRRAEGD